ncbi:hypothetical protein INR49_006051 [Caranx melampygus]|nr:hypothetical protein INR49_006051 [Caranx melampygus]
MMCHEETASFCQVTYAARFIFYPPPPPSGKVHMQTLPQSRISQSVHRFSVALSSAAGSRARAGMERNINHEAHTFYTCVNNLVACFSKTLPLDYKRLQSKVEKYEEKDKTGPVMVKLHQAREELRPVREDFEAKNKQLLDEMPKFYHSRIDYFQPSFEALIRAQVVYFTEMYKIFSELTDQIDQAGLTDEQRERETEAKLSELRALSIVADD